MPLSDMQCRTARLKEKPYKLADSGGLYLEVMPSGTKYWRLKYRMHGKEKRIALGVYADYIDEVYLNELHKNTILQRNYVIFS